MLSRETQNTKQNYYLYEYNTILQYERETTNRTLPERVHDKKQIGVKQCKTELRGFRKMAENEEPLMIGVHVDDTLVSGEQDTMFVKLFGQQKQRFPVKNGGTKNVHWSRV